MSRRRLILGIASVGYAKLVVVFSQLVLVPVLALAWGLPLYGQWILLSTVPVFLAAGDFGFATIAGNRVIAAVAKKDQETALVNFQSGFVITLITGATLSVIVVGIALALPDSMLRVEGAMAPPSARLVLILLSLGGVVAMLRSLFVAASRSMGKFAQAAGWDANFMLVETLAIMAVAGLGGGTVGAAIAFVMVRTVATLVQVQLARHYAGWLSLGAARAKWSVIRSMARPSLAVMLFPLSNAGFLQGTAIAVAAAGGTALVPIYTALRTLARTGQQLLQTLSLPIMPEYTAADAVDDRPRAEALAGSLATLSIIGGVIFALGFALLGSAFLRLWTGGAIAAPQSAILLFATSVIFGSVWTQLVNLLIAVNRHEQFSILFAAGTLAGVMITYLLVREIGVTGGAAGYLFVDAAMTATVVWLLNREGRTPRLGFAAVRTILGARGRGAG